MRRFSKLQRWAKTVLLGLLGAAVFWLALPRLAGGPAWLRGIGFLPWLEKLNPLDQWIVGVATFAAIAVALFPDQLRDFLWPVRLGFETVAGVSIPLSEPVMNAHHYRLAITARGGAAARRVEVVISEVWKDGARANWWSPAALNWTDANKPFRPVLARDTTRLCDFLMMIEPSPMAAKCLLGQGAFQREDLKGTDFATTAGIFIKRWRDPNGRQNLITPAKYTVALELSADNVKPSTSYVEVEFAGRWDENPDLCVSIRNISRPPK